MFVKSSEMHSISHSGKQKRAKRAKIKKERVEKPSSAAVPVPAIDDDTEKDLTHFIRDRVELMRQVFSILKDRELVAMAPQCLRTVKADDLQELCLDEVLGISSTRLASILDGCSCPSDTDSSDASQDAAPQLLALETISLDSISSDEGQPPLDLAHLPTKPKKKKHHRRHQEQEQGTGSAGRGPEKGERGERGPAGMTVLELLELQARARAIRAQLQAVHANIVSDPEEEESFQADGNGEGDSGDEDEVVIKEEPPEVVEVVSSSSDGEQPSDKSKSSGNAKKSSTSGASSKDKSKNDQVKAVPTLVVSMPVIVAQNPPRKIKLKRNNLLVSVTNMTGTSSAKPVQEVNAVAKSPVIDLDKAKEAEAMRDTPKDIQKDATTQGNGKRKTDKGDSQFVDGVKSSKVKGEKEGAVPFDGRIDGKSVKDRLGKGRKPKNKGTGKASKKKGKTSIDEDEIMLELSDTEKHDLLDSFNSKSSSEESSEEEAAVDPGKDAVDKLTTEDDNAVKTEGNDEAMEAGGDVELTIVSDEAKNPDNGDQVTNVDKSIIESQNDGVVFASPGDEVIDLDSGGEVGKNAADSLEEITISEDVEAVKSPDNADLDQSLAAETKLSQHQAIEETETDKDKNQSSKKKKKKSKKSSRESRRSNEATVSEKTKKHLEEDPESVGKKKRRNSVKDLENLQPNNAAKEVLLGDSLNIGTGLESIRPNESVVSVQISEEELSEGECSYSSDGIEITELKHEVVSISDDAISVDSVEEGRPKKRKYRKRRKSQSNRDHDSSSSEDYGKRKDPSIEISKTENADDSKNTDEELGKYDDAKEVESACLLQDNTHKDKLDGALGGSVINSGNETNNTKKNTMEPEDNKIVATYMKTEKVDLEKGRVHQDSAADTNKDDDYEIFEVSDDSSDEEATSLSKEPTTEEIVELSKKIDSEIDREDIIFERRITGEMVDVEMRQEILKSVGVSAEELTDSSWKERWLKSDKVRKVLATSNLCNALRKKNKEIKLKLIEDAKEEQAMIKKQKHDEESRLKHINKLETRVETDLNVEDAETQRILEPPGIGVTTGINDHDDTETKIGHKGAESDVKTDECCIKGIKNGVETNETCIVDAGLGDRSKAAAFGEDRAVEGTKIDVEQSKLEPDEGSVDLYMTLASCTKYVDPVIDHIEENRKKAMAKDARQLMKMYKKLVKIHSKVAGEKKQKKKEKKERKEKKSKSNNLSNIT